MNLSVTYFTSSIGIVDYMHRYPIIVFVMSAVDENKFSTIELNSSILLNIKLDFNNMFDSFFMNLCNFRISLILFSRESCEMSLISELFCAMHFTSIRYISRKHFQFQKIVSLGTFFFRHFTSPSRKYSKERVGKDFEISGWHTPAAHLSKLSRAFICRYGLGRRPSSSSSSTTYNFRVRYDL